MHGNDAFWWCGKTMYDPDPTRSIITIFREFGQLPYSTPEGRWLSIITCGLYPISLFPIRYKKNTCHLFSQLQAWSTVFLQNAKPITVRTSKDSITADISRREGNENVSARYSLLRTPQYSSTQKYVGYCWHVDPNVPWRRRDFFMTVRSMYYKFVELSDEIIIGNKLNA